MKNIVTKFISSTVFFASLEPIPSNNLTTKNAFSKVNILILNWSISN